MNNITTWFLLILLSMGMFSCREKPTTPVRRTISGRIVAVGNAPFVKLVLRDREDAVYEIGPSEREKVKGLQGHFITMEADVLTVEMKTADGKYSRKIKVLKGIALIKE